MAMKWHTQILLILSIAVCVNAKFEQVYSSPMLSAALPACIAASANETDRNLNCRKTFKCLFTQLTNEYQAIYSAGSTILGIIPTITFLLGNTNGELVLIHTRYPLLALLLSVTSINGNVGRLEWISRESVDQASLARGHTWLGPYGLVLTHGPSLKHTHLWQWTVAQLFALAGAVAVVYITVELGIKGLLVWACWTTFYPGFWVLMGLVQHIILVICLRLSLQTRAANEDTELQSLQGDPNQASTPRPRLKSARRSALITRDLMGESEQTVEIANERLINWSKALMDLLGTAAYLYGTMVFSSITLVSPVQAIRVLAVFGVSAIATRFIAAWTLKGIRAPVGMERSAVATPN